MKIENTSLVELYKSPQTVFTIPDLALIWKETDTDLIKSRIHYYVKAQKMSSPRRGIYTKQNYEVMELATKMYSPSYISFETVLTKSGVTFQWDTRTTVASSVSRSIEVEKQQIVYHKIKSEILLDLSGVVNMGQYHIASVERSFLDCLYLYGPIHFDNLRPIDWNICRSLSGIYTKKSFRQMIESYARQN
jgi:hypothetical protein